MILGLAVGKLEYLFGTLRQLKDSLPVEQEYLTTLIKMIGITYIGQFSAGICKDAGHQATAAQIELFCRGFPFPLPLVALSSSLMINTKDHSASVHQLLMFLAQSD